MRGTWLPGRPARSDSTRTARSPGAARGVATKLGYARCSSRRWVAFRRAQAQQRQQIGQIDQPFRLCLLIRAECRPTVLLVEKRPREVRSAYVIMGRGG